MIDFTCPHCGVTGRAKPEAAGRQATCKCGGRFTVPSESTNNPAAESPSAPDSNVELAASTSDDFETFPRSPVIAVVAGLVGVIVLLLLAIMSNSSSNNQITADEKVELLQHVSQLEFEKAELEEQLNRARAVAEKLPAVPRPAIQSSPIIQWRAPFSYSQFEELREGMTYEAVVKLLGAEGVQQSSTTVAGISGFTSDVQIVAYSWQNRDGSNLMAHFHNGRLNLKVQFGLK